MDKNVPGLFSGIITVPGLFSGIIMLLFGDYYCTWIILGDCYYPPNFFGDYYCLSFRGLLLPPYFGDYSTSLFEMDVGRLAPASEVTGGNTLSF
jgi:hypothetical protein